MVEVHTLAFACIQLDHADRSLTLREPDLCLFSLDWALLASSISATTGCQARGLLASAVRLQYLRLVEVASQMLRAVEGDAALPLQGARRHRAASILVSRACCRLDARCVTGQVLGVDEGSRRCSGVLGLVLARRLLHQHWIIGRLLALQRHLLLGLGAQFGLLGAHALDAVEGGEV